MKKTLFIFLTLLSFSKVFSQVTPPPVNPQQVNTMQWWYEPSTKKMFAYRGATLLWANMTDSIQVARMISSSVGSGITASNGLTKIGPDIQLGGILTKTTTIGGTFDFNIYNGTLGSGSLSFIGVQGGSGSLNYINQLTGINRKSYGIVTAPFAVTMFAQREDDANSIKINMNTDGIHVVDGLNGTGIENDGNYHAGIATHPYALVDRSYLDSINTGKANLAGGNTFTGDQTISNANLYITGINHGLTLDAGSFAYNSEQLVTYLSKRNGWAVIGANGQQIARFSNESPGTDQGYTSIDSKVSLKNMVNINDYGTAYDLLARVSSAAGGDEGLIGKIPTSTFASSANTYTKSQSDSLSNDNEKLLGTLYNKTTWGNLSDFTDNSSNASISGGKIIFGTGSNTYSSYLLYNLNGKTVLEKYRQPYKITVLAKNSTTYGTAFGSKSALSGTVAYNFAARIDLTNTGTSGQLTILGGESTGTFPVLATSSTNVSFNIGDQLEAIVERNITTFTFSVRNVTQNGNYVSVSYDFPTINSGTVHLPNTSSFAIYNLGGSVQIDSAAITSNEVKNAALALVTDSKAVIGTYFARDRVSSILDKYYPSTIMFSGAGDVTATLLSRINEIIAAKPKQVVLLIGRNDLGNSVPDSIWKANYANITSQLQSAGITVYHMLPLWEPGLNQTSLSNFIITNYPSSNIISCNIVGADLTYDLIHLNEQGHSDWANSIISSGKIKSQLKLNTYDKLKDNTLLTGALTDQTIIGNVAPSGNLNLISTNTSGTKGKINFGGNKLSWYDEQNKFWVYSNTGVTPSIAAGPAAYDRTKTFSDGAQIIHTNIVSSSTATDATNYIFQKSGGSFSSPSALGSSDNTGILRFDAYDGAAFRSTADIHAQMDGTISSGVAPQALYFATGTTNSRNNRWKIASTGMLNGISVINPTSGVARGIFLQQTFTPTANSDDLRQVDLTGVTFSTGSGFLTATITTNTTSAADGTYTAQPITATSGSGTGGAATFVVSGGLVTTVTQTTGGTGFAVGNTFTSVAVPGAVFTVATLGYNNVHTTDLRLNKLQIVANTTPTVLANGDLYQTGSRLFFRQSSVSNQLAYNPMTGPGDMVYGGTSGGETRIAPNATTTPLTLQQFGNGTTANAPAWVNAATQTSTYSNKTLAANTTTYQGTTGAAGDSLRFASGGKMVEKAVVVQSGTGLSITQSANTATFANDTTTLLTRSNGYTRAQLQTKLNTFYSTSATPSIVAGANAGTGATVSIVGSNQDGIITINTGISATTGLYCTVTMSGGFSYPNKCTPVISHVDGAIITSSDVTVDSTSTSWTISVNGALASSSTYKWTYHNGGY